jgi:radical SAM superfamily enzyme YgiQ (UPF0313 family)
MLASSGAKGIDFATHASTPQEIRLVFEQLRTIARGRMERTVDPVPHYIPAKPEDWPLPDFGIYDVDRYRRDPFLANPSHFPGYDKAVGPVLLLPYHFTYDCQYVCTFCQRGGKQTAKAIDHAVRDLATLSERWGTTEFIFFNAQVNLYAEALAKALVEARVAVHWSDSYRVRPSKPGALETLARGGCVGLTFGVESASEKMLRKMIKGHLAWHATRVLEEAQQNDILTRVNLLPCFPGETREDFLVTRDWLEATARVIDDIAPSSFYLAKGSPIGMDPDKFGIRLRGQRLLLGDHKFRKNLGSLEYDEIDGMTWEERSQTLRPYEEELRQAWERGRGEVGAFRFLTGMMMHGMRRTFPTKAEAFGAMLRWRRGLGTPRPVVAARPPEPRAMAVGDGEG